MKHPDPSTYKSAVIEEVLHYGVNSIFDSRQPLGCYLEEIFYTGYCVIENLIDDNALSEISMLIDRIYSQQMQEIGGTFAADIINDANIVRCPMAYDKIFISLAKHPVIIDIMKQILGQSFLLLMQNAIINRPDQGNYQTRWHRDLNYQHWTSSKPLALNALFCIDPFMPETGCTYVLPSSHLREAFPSDDFVRKHQVPVIASSGSLVIMDAMLYHRAGINISDKPRRALNHVIGLPFMSQQIDISVFVGENLPDDEFSNTYFGRRWHPASSAKEWRASKNLKIGR